MKAITLIRIDFDSLENHRPVSEAIVQTFVAESGVGSPYAVMQEWWKTQPAVAHYAGYDGQVYPQFKTHIQW